MSDAFSKVRPGEPLKIAAQAWNQVIDQVTTRPRFDAATSAAPPINFQVRCRNSTSGDVPRWGVLQITGILETPTGATGAYATGPQEPGTISFLSYPGVVGVTPTSDAGARFVVATQPIKAGEVGMAAIDGVVQVKLDVTADDDKFAAAKDGSVEHMTTASDGDSAVLWKGGPTGVQWGLVRIGSGAGAGVRVGKTTSAWPKNSLATIDLHEEGTPPTETAKDPPDTLPDCVNKIADVGDDRWVIVARGANGYWYLVWAEPELVDVVVDVELGEAGISFGRKTIAVYTVEPDPEPLSIVVTECPPDEPPPE